MFKSRNLNVFWLILIVLDNNYGDAKGIRSPASEFSRHSVVRPILHHAKTKREMTSTRHKSSTCGNGFVEPGEQCDCGLVGDAACIACCHPRACVLRSNATCAAGECCDTATCHPKVAGTECRAAEMECDLPEYCSGHSEYCPRDVHKMDATPCADDKAYCAGGLCRTHTDQCRLLWGLSGEMADVNCYTKLNTKGNRRGSCGYRRENPEAYKCAIEDALCGLLQCTLHDNEKLELGLETISIISSFAYIQVNGHCHCDPGYAPPFCTRVCGGSVDSGPVTLCD